MWKQHRPYMNEWANGNGDCVSTKLGLWTWKFVLFFVCLASCFLGPHLRHIEVPRLGVQSELQLPTYTTATVMQYTSHVYNLHHSSRQHQILNPLSEARDQTLDLMVPKHWATTETPWKKLFLSVQNNRLSELNTFLFIYSWSCWRTVFLPSRPISSQTLYVLIKIDFLITNLTFFRKMWRSHLRTFRVSPTYEGKDNPPPSLSSVWYSSSAACHCPVLTLDLNWNNQSSLLGLNYLAAM